MQENLNIITAAEEINAEIEKRAEESKQKNRTTERGEPKQNSKTIKQAEEEVDPNHPGTRAIRELQKFYESHGDPDKMLILEEKDVMVFYNKKTKELTISHGGFEVVSDRKGIEKKQSRKNYGGSDGSSFIPPKTYDEIQELKEEAMKIIEEENFYEEK